MGEILLHLSIKTHFIIWFHDLLWSGNLHIFIKIQLTE